MKDIYMSVPLGNREKRREEILQAASEVFFEAGYKGTSIDAVIEKVGGSKRAIYSYFGSKKELFAAIVTELSNRALAALEPDELGGHDVQAVLTDFGQRVLEVVMSPTTLALYRAVVAEGTRFPELAEVFFNNGPGRASVRLTEVLEQFKHKGQIEVEDCQLAAEYFIGMLRSDRHLRTTMGLQEPPGEMERNQMVQQAVKIFLDGCKTYSNKA